MSSKIHPEPLVVLQTPVVIKPEPAEVELYIYAEVRDADGNLIWEMPQRKSDSFVQNFLIFIGAMFDAVTTIAQDQDNAARNIYQVNNVATTSFRGDASVGNDDFGIIIGSDNTAPTNTDYWLTARIDDGSSAGEMMYNIQQIAAPAEVGANVDMEYKRVFTNLSGASITVYECGISVFGATAYYHLIAHDLLGAGIAVADNASLLIMYTWRTTV